MHRRDAADVRALVQGSNRRSPGDSHRDRAALPSRHIRQRQVDGLSSDARRGRRLIEPEMLLNNRVVCMDMVQKDANKRRCVDLTLLASLIVPLTAMIARSCVSPSESAVKVKTSTPWVGSERSCVVGRNIVVGPGRDFIAVGYR